MLTAAAGLMIRVTTTEFVWCKLRSAFTAPPLNGNFEAPSVDLDSKIFQFGIVVHYAEGSWSFSSVSLVVKVNLLKLW